MFRLKDNYAVFSIIFQVVSTFTSFLCLRWIRPEDIGLWQSFVIFEPYFFIIRFGVFNAFNREYSFNLGRNDDQKAKKIFHTTESYALIVSILILFSILSALFFFQSKSDAFQISIVVFGVLVASSIYKSFIEITYRCADDFKKLSIVYTIISILYIVSLPLVYKFNFHGFLLRIMILSLLSVALLLYFRPAPFKFNLNIKVFTFLFKTGFPLFISNYVTSITASFNRIILLTFTSIAVLGLFTPVQSVFYLGMLISGAYAAYFLPKLNFDYGKNGNKLLVIKNAMSQALRISIMLSGLTIICVIVSPFIVNTLIPEYSQTTFAIQLICLSWPLQGIKSVSMVFSVLKAWNQLYIFIIANFVLCLLIPYLFLTNRVFDDSILNISTSLLVIEFLMFIVIILLINYLRIKKAADEIEN